MSGTATSKESAAFCADLVRTHDFSRYAASLFLPQARRRALLSIYAFNVEISRVRDQVSQPAGEPVTEDAERGGDASVRYRT